MRAAIAFCAGFLVAILLMVTAAAAVGAASPEPASAAAPTLNPTRYEPGPTPTITPSPTPGPTAAPASSDAHPLSPFPNVRAIDPINVTRNITLGLTGLVQCWNCAPFQPSYNGQPVKVKLSNYTPWAGGPNCWDWSEDFNYCMSETRSGLAWEEFYGLAAACPAEWDHGAWVNVEGVGAFICLDTGNDVVCHDGSETEQAAGEPPHCHVDILGPGGQTWQQKQFDAVLWVSLNPR